MQPKLICDLGSTCTKSMNLCRQSILSLSELIPAPSVKFQLCPAGGTNRPLPKDWLKPLVEYGKELGVKVFASIWDPADIAVIKDAGCTAIKLAWSSDRSLIAPCREAGLTVLITRKLMEDWVPFPGVLNMWTVEGVGSPLYPVTAVQHHQDMLRRYEGFSSHILSPYANQTAFKAGYQVMEVHANVVGDTESADSKFALTLEDIRKIGGQVK